MNSHAEIAATKKPRLKLKWLLLLGIVFTTIAFVFIPVWFIQPFRPQTTKMVALSYALKSWSPIVTVLLTMLALFLAVTIWRARKGIFRKIFLVLVFIPMFAATWFARQNHFEWMFNPLPNPAYAKLNEANFVSDNDMVLAVEINGEAVAYPVRQMAYHHVVQDVVGGKPITATY